MAKAAKTAQTNTSVSLTPSAAALLAALVSAPDYVPASDDAKALAAAGFITVDTNDVNDAGAKATVTDAGKAYAVANPAPASDAPKFAISFGEQIVKRRAGRAGTSVYPFDQLPAPEAIEGSDRKRTARFFVPATADRKEPWKSLTTTVSGASAKYRTQTGTNEKGKPVYEYERRFSVTRGKDDAGVEGAWIERIK